MKKLIFILGIFTLFLIKVQYVKAIDFPDNYQIEKQQFRAVWVATVENLDMLIYKLKEQYQSEYLRILDNLESLNMNAIIFQVRPLNDAFYNSNLNPWSRYLAGSEGTDPGWDILSWMIDETHKRGIEFHAWFNPYRVTNVPINNKESYLQSLDEKNFARKNPNYVLQGKDNKLILNPGEPEVRQFILDTVMEVVQNYDIDGIHFDDYFYPYGGGLKDGEDSKTFSLYNPENKSLADWRRDNVTSIIRNVKENLNDYNTAHHKGIQFGISPFGIWANIASNPLGSNTRGLQSYYDQYADTRGWVKSNYVDYIVPQVYWEFGYSVAAYEEIVDWWADVVKGTNVNLYIGHAIYKYILNSDTPAWSNYKQIPNQILYNQNHPEIKGSVFFSYRDLFKSSNAAIISAKQFLQSEYFSNPALNAPLKNINITTPVDVMNLQVDSTENLIKLTWDKNNLAKFFVVYRFNENEEIDLNDTTKILDIIYNIDGEKTNYTDTKAQSAITYQYVVTTLDYANNESLGKTVINQPINVIPKISGYKDIDIEAKTTKPNWLEGITASDGYGNDISNLLTVDDSLVNINLIGDYHLVYNITDNYNLSTTVTINVHVRDTLPPEITLIKELNVYVNANKPNWLEFIKAYDLYDGDITNKVEVDDSRIEIDKVGKYFIIFNVSDMNNNSLRKIEKVNVIESDVIDDHNETDKKNNPVVLVTGIIVPIVIIGGIILIKRKK